MAIQGSGYFRITMPDGTFSYTRSGNFALSPTGQIVTQQGYAVAPGISVPPTATNVQINAQGQVLAAIPELVGPLAKYGTFFYGFILLIVVLALPGGFDDLIRNIAARLRREEPVSTSIEPDLERLRSAIRGGP